MLTKCVNCEFNVRQDAEFCLNCGTENPSKASLFSEKRDLPLGLTVLIILICMVLAVVVKINMEESRVPNLSLSNLVPALLIGFIVGIPVSMIGASWINLKVVKKAKRERTLAKAGRTLCSKEDEIYEKIYLFSEDNTYLESLLNELNGDSDQERDYTAEEENILKRFEIIACEIALCNLQLEEIRLLRRENKVLPFLKNINFLTLDEIEDALPVVEQKIDEEEEGSQELEMEIDVEDGDRIHKYIAEADEIINHQYSESQISCENLYEALNRRKTALEQGKTPIQELAVSTKNLPDYSDNLKIDSMLTDFSVYFAELAAEHKHLDKMSENKIV